MWNFNIIFYQAQALSTFASSPKLLTSKSDNKLHKELFSARLKRDSDDFSKTKSWFEDHGSFKAEPQLIALKTGLTDDSMVTDDLVDQFFFFSWCSWKKWGCRVNLSFYHFVSGINQVVWRREMSQRFPFVTSGVWELPLITITSEVEWFSVWGVCVDFSSIGGLCYSEWWV